MTTLPQSLVLESGDHLDREEFHRRYTLRPDIHKAELINGVVYVASPTSDMHSRPHGWMAGWVFTYRRGRRDVEMADAGTVFLTETSQLEPDVCLYRLGPGSQVRHIMRDGGRRWLEGAPELVIEISVSSTSKDLHAKLDAYREAGVIDYIVWDVEGERILWFYLDGDHYVELQPDERGVIESRHFAGLRLNVPAMLIGDLDAVVDELRPPA